MKTRYLVAMLACAATASLQARDVAKPDFKGRLARGVYWLVPDISRSLKALADESADEVRTRLESAAARGGRIPLSVRESLQGERPLRENMWRGLLALQPGGPDDALAELAGAIAREAPMDAEQKCYDADLEPKSGCDRSYAIVQARWAETYLKEHRDSPFTPYLYGFLMTRYRLAYEYATQADDVDARKAAARKYRTFLLRGRTMTEPLARWVIEDIDRMPHAEVATDIHPRDYDPDACCNGRRGE
jgi:hypothetical protein